MFFFICFNMLIISAQSRLSLFNYIPLNIGDISTTEDNTSPVKKMQDAVRNHNYPLEEHKIKTQDGYLLNVFRIPHGKMCNSSQNDKRPSVILWHGLLDCSITWVITGPESGLAFKLADNCYDVWMPNSRGSVLSREHINLDPTNDAQDFWKFSWHEIGIYDVPAVVDYILQKTKASNLFYVGHSQGTTQFFVFGSMLPNYNKKIRAMFALAPVAYMKHVRNSALLRGFLAFYNINRTFLLSLVGKYEFIPQTYFLKPLSKFVCKESMPTNHIICVNIMFLLMGFDQSQFNSTITEVMSEYLPAGASVRQVAHYAQGINHGGFRQFDFEDNNNQIYGTDEPPEYNLEGIRVNISLFYGKNDVLAPINDVGLLSGRLPQLVESYVIPYEEFNHLDFLFANDRVHLVYNHLIKALKRS